MIKRENLHGPELENKELPSISQKLLKSLRDKDKTKTAAFVKSMSKKQLSKLPHPFKEILFFREVGVKRFLGKFSGCLSYLYKIDRNQIRFGLRLYVAIYEKLALENGPLFAVKTLKELHGISLRYCSSQVFTPIERFKLDKEGIPLLLRPFRRYLKGSLEERRACIEILSLYKLVIVENNNVNYNSITSPSKFEGSKVTLPDSIKPGSFFAARAKESPELVGPRGVTINDVNKAWLKVINAAFPKEYLDDRIGLLKEESDLHISSKNGPNGPCLSSIPLDFEALAKTNRPLLTSIIRFASLTENEKLVNMINSFVKRTRDGKVFKREYIGKGETPTLTTSRLRIKQESGGKARVFAICDWFSQSALKGLHESIFKRLQKYPEDGTFSQGRVSEIVRKWTIGILPESEYPESVDLTTATDRIPATLQSEILYSMIGEPLAFYWYHIVTGRVFSSPDGVDRKYKVGQPMGILSSWAMLALWHHMVMRTVCRLCGKRSTEEDPLFVVIGDDVAMRGSNMASMYKFIVEDICGVSISSLKGYSSLTRTNNNPLDGQEVIPAEIAKRVFLNGRELTPVPPDEYKAAFEYPADYPTLIASMNRRGYDISLEDILHLASYNYKPRRAIEAVSFPLSCPWQFDPLVSHYLANDVEYDYHGIPWFSFATLWTREFLARSVNRLLRDELKKEITKIRETIKEYREKPELFNTGKWRFTSIILGVFLFRISNLMYSKLGDILFGDTSPIWRVGLLSVDLKSFIGKFHVVFEYDMALRGKSEFKDEKKKTSRFVSEFLSYFESNYDSILDKDFEYLSSHPRAQSDLNTTDSF